MMSKKRLAVLLAVSILATSVPVTGERVYAEEAGAQEVIEVTGAQELFTAEEEAGDLSSGTGTEGTGDTMPEPPGTVRGGSPETRAGEEEPQAPEDGGTTEDGISVWENVNNAIGNELGRYKVTNEGTKEVTFIKAFSMGTVIRIPNYILVTDLNGTGTPTSIEYLNDVTQESVQSNPDVMDFLYKVTSIEEDCFKNAFAVRTIELPNTIKTEITYKFFEDCRELSDIRVEFNSKGETYGRYYDGGQEKYGNNTNSKEAAGVLVDCTKDVSGNILGQTIIRCPKKTGLTRYVYPDKTFRQSCKVEVGPYAFEGCENLTMVSSGSETGNSNRFQKIGAHAFEGCTSLVDAYVFDMCLKEIGDEAFKNCTSLAKAEFSTNPTGDPRLDLGSNVFENTVIRSLSLPYYLTQISANTVFGMERLAEISVASYNTKYMAEDNVLYSKDPQEGGRGSRLIVCPSAKAMPAGEFKIPYGITEFDQNAFYACRNLNTLIFPSNIDELDQGVFRDCRYIREIYIYSGFPDLAKDSGGNYYDIFSGCGYSNPSVIIRTGKGTPAWEFAKQGGYDVRALYDPDDFRVTMSGNSLAVIGFDYTPDYRDLVIPAKLKYGDEWVEVTAVESGVLAKPGMTSVMFLANMERVSADAFRIIVDEDDASKDIFAENLRNIYIEEGNKFLRSENGVLYQVRDDKISGLIYYPAGRIDEEFYAPEELEYIPVGVFRGASNLKKIHIYDNIQGIGSEHFGSFRESAAFAGCKNLVAIEIEPSDDDERVKYYGSDKGVLYARVGNTFTTLIYYPKGERKPADVTYSAIAYEVVNGCTRIMDMRNCTYLKHIVIPASVEQVDARAFEGSTELSTVEFRGNGIKEIGDQAFANTKIEAISLPDSIETIGDRAFYRCTGLMTVQIAGNSLISIGEEAFYGDRNIRSVTISSEGRDPSGDATIGKRAFRSLARLESLEITNLQSVSFGDRAFAYDTSLKTVNFDNSKVIRIDMGAFQGCTSLTGLNLEDSITLAEIGQEAFKECSSLETVKFPENLHRIEQGVFENCVMLGDLNFEELRGLMAIGGNAFRNTGFSVIRLRDGITSLGSGAFGDSKLLTAAYVPASVRIDPADGNPFSGVDPDQLTVYGPAGTTMAVYAEAHSIRYVSGDIPNIGINLSQTDLTLYDAGITTAQLDATTQPENHDVIWVSSNPDVAYIADKKNGFVQAVAPGEARVYAICVGSGSRAVCNVKVVKTEVVIPEESRIMNLKEKVQINAASVPLRQITYTTSNKRIATVSKRGIVTAKKVGPATITATAGEGDTLRSDTINITVVKPTISLDKKKITLNEKGDGALLSEELIVTHFGAYEDVTWTSSNPRIATVKGDNESAVVTAMRAGNVTITATCNGKKAKCRVQVKPVYTRLNKTSATMYVGGTSYETLKLKAKVSGMSKEVEWVSDHPEYAYVDERGVVTAQSRGTAVITATANGVTAQCTITVMDSTITILDHEGAELRPAIIVLNSIGNNKGRLNTRVVGRNKTVKWTSLAKDIVTIDKNGQLTGRNAGETEVVASANGVESYCTVKVLDTRTELDFENITLSVKGEYGDPKMRTLTVTIEGSDLRKAVKWESSNPEIAAITSADKVARQSQTTSEFGGIAAANITAVKPGKATISVTANGVTAKCVVEVIED